ncbi:MAG: GNAT family N-acetyltransferase [Nocardioidaceae bacterium]
MTERLTLRPHRDDDLQAMLTYYADPDVARYLLEEPWTQEYAEAQLTKRIARQHIGAPDQALALVVERDGAVIGDVAMWPADKTLSVAELGWVIHPDAGGKGFATEAVLAVIGLAFGHYGMHRVKAQLDARNTPSARMCERLGMTKEAHLRQDWWSKGEWTDTAVYGLLAAELDGGRDG